VAYNATKHAILGLSKSISLEGRDFDICCTQLDIGNAETDRTTRMRQGALQPDGSTRPEALMDVSNISRTILYLADLPLEANVPFLTITALGMPFIGRG
jgi:NAD(P)-dependent dehydrogenase (short-subunit alcohol dehydrogenase family)